MKKWQLILFGILAAVILLTDVDATGVFPIIEINKDLNTANFLINIYNPPAQIDKCLDINNTLIDCTPQFALILPQWQKIQDTTITTYVPRRFIFYNPKTTAKLLDECMKFSADESAAGRFELNSYKFTPLVTSQLINTTFAWNLNPGGSSCYVYSLPIYNPYFINKDKTKYYPFDSYVLEFGVSFPYKTDFQGMVFVPEQFTITDMRFNTTSTAPEVRTNKNVGYFNFKPKVNEWQLFQIAFSRTPDFGSHILPIILLFGTLSALILFFLLSSSPEVDNTKSTRLNTFYLAVLPLFFSMLTFMQDKPKEFTLFDLIVSLSAIFLILNMLKDFTGRELLKNKKYRLIIAALACILMAIMFMISQYSS